jgi:hypothetical protein
MTIFSRKLTYNRYKIEQRSADENKIQIYTLAPQYVRGHQRIVIEYKMYIRPPKIANKCIHTRWLACWTKLIIFQLYRGGQFYCWRKPEYQEITTNMSQVTDELLWTVCYEL